MTMQPGSRGRRPDPNPWGAGYGGSPHAGAPVPARRRTTAVAPKTSDGGLGSALGAGIGFTVLTWVVFFVNQIFFLGGLNHLLGLRPLDTHGLWGILFAPVLHADMQHLMANTVPAALFAALIAFTSKKLWLQVTALVMLVSGVATWFIGGVGTAHVGASGLVYGWLAFLIVRGFYNRAPHGGQDHLDDGDRVPLAGVAQEGGRRGVAGDDDHLAAALDEVVGDGLGVPAHVGDAQRTVGPVGGVADVDHRFVRQLVDDRSRHRQPADAGVEHPDRCGAVDFQLAVVMLVDAHRPALPRLSMDAAMIPPMAPNRCICQLTPISVGNTPQIKPE